ncbi:MAG TPA: hypothetical protein VMM15_14925 [Bradyrhizobium sp.]|nr:hypothetical protein [Bradyrhizobium sp.]
MILYAQSSGEHYTDSGVLVPIPGLSVTFTQGVIGAVVTAILNLPLPYAIGTDFPGGKVGISVNGAIAPVPGGFTYNEQNPPVPGRIPTTLVVSVPLPDKLTFIMGMWSGVRGSRIIIDSPATLTVFF